MQFDMRDVRSQEAGVRVEVEMGSKASAGIWRDDISPLSSID